jgi:photosystem II stability/assembly factor-like uncharacterized protein
MLTPTSGWALGQTRQRQKNGVLRTSDSGNHWTDVTPSIARNAPYVPTFLDLEHAWVAVAETAGPTPGHAITAFRTRDGGVTWEEGTPLVIGSQYPPVEPLGDGLQFVDAQHGWLTVQFMTGPGGSNIAIYRTQDGGLHWKLVSITLGPGKSSAESLPVGCNKTGVVFNSPLAGWATAHCGIGSPFLYQTRDGGQTWHEQGLPPPAGYPESLASSCDCITLPPRFVTATDGVLAMLRPDAMYLTHDGGASWKPTQLPTKFIGDLPDFVTARDGWIQALRDDPVTRNLSFDRLYVTHDAGESWQPIKPDHDIFGPLDFINADNGWSIYFKRPGKLLSTKDGGRTWQELTPEVVGTTESERT